LNKDELLPVGRITGLHGLRGEVKLLPYGGLDEFTWKTVVLIHKGEKSSFSVRSVRRHRGSFIIALDGFTTREASEPLVGSELYIPKSVLAGLPAGEYYYVDLIGMEVSTDDHRYLGHVTNVIAAGPQDVLEINGPFGEVLVPAVEQFVVEVDRDGKKIVVHLLEGLLPDER
jgi:16S rRNA processing protein RimM